MGRPSGKQIATGLFVLAFLFLVAWTISTSILVLDPVLKDLGLGVYEMKKTADRIAAKNQLLVNANATISATVGEIATLQTTLTTSNKTIADQLAIIGARDATIATQLGTINTQTTTIADQLATISDHVQTIDAKDDAINDHVSTIAAREKQILENIRSISDLTDAVAARDATIAGNVNDINTCRQTNLENTDIIASNRKQIDLIRSARIELDVKYNALNEENQVVIGKLNLAENKILEHIAVIKELQDRVINITAELDSLNNTLVKQRDRITQLQIQLTTAQRNSNSYRHQRDIYAKQLWLVDDYILKRHLNPYFFPEATYGMNVMSKLKDMRNMILGVLREKRSMHCTAYLKNSLPEIKKELAYLKTEINREKLISGEYTTPENHKYLKGVSWHTMCDTTDVGAKARRRLNNVLFNRSYPHDWMSLQKTVNDGSNPTDALKALQDEIALVFGELLRGKICSNGSIDLNNVEKLFDNIAYATCSRTAWDNKRHKNIDMSLGTTAFPFSVYNNRVLTHDSAMKSI